MFELSPPVNPGDPWAEKVLYNFQGGADGRNPYGGVTFDTTGTYGYFCIPHGSPGAGMHGTIIVQ